MAMVSSAPAGSGLPIGLMPGALPSDHASRQTLKITAMGLPPGHCHPPCCIRWPPRFFPISLFRAPFCKFGKTRDAACFESLPGPSRFLRHGRRRAVSGGGVESLGLAAEFVPGRRRFGDQGRAGGHAPPREARAGAAPALAHQRALPRKSPIAERPQDREKESA